MSCVEKLNAPRVRRARSAGKIICAAFGLAILAVSPAHAQASKLPDLNEHVHFFAVEEDVVNILRMIALNAGLRLEATGKVRGNIVNKTFDGQINTIVEQLSKQFNLDWYVAGDTLYVSNMDERTTRIVNLNRIDFKDVSSVLDASGLPSERFSMRSVSNGRALLMSGPPSYLAMAETILEQRGALTASRMSLPDAATIRVIKYGVSSDIVVR